MYVICIHMGVCIWVYVHTNKCISRRVNASIYVMYTYNMCVFIGLCVHIFICVHTGMIHRVGLDAKDTYKRDNIVQKRPII